ncbi:bifunctional (p)ppGpp synthetase/guanosine-3',5'-bis(diphosphate) 3'-pyrophosphohydrolase [Candidatus Peregrinibacteria bacterium]|nr:MAG: bifunctional (p)ppGpp synthetase/guanosine-3',5'-bis(diphosphate) 3'-pyrophosphohydrolase [Candidatus Peregrinibacteria bacterium]
MNHTYESGNCYQRDYSEGEDLFAAFKRKRIYRAYEIANEAHAGQFRESGEPYITHPLAVTEILLDLKPDEDSIVTSLLHDVLEDTDIPLERLTDEFGEKITPLLKGLEKLGKVHYSGRDRQIENLRKMFMAMAKDLRVILIKLADRLHNMRTLGSLKKEEKKARVAQETLEIYSPIAARLGIYKIKDEMDEIGFQYVFPKEFERIQEELKELTGEQENIIRKAKHKLLGALKKEGIEASIAGRVKSSFSIHKKLKNKGKNYVSELYDIFALRILVPNEADCYRTLGVIHKLWTPVPRRFKDYIAVSKANGYQSLHTTLIGLSDSGGHPMEVQIRTEDMNRVAEFGVAAHWSYKEGYALEQEKKLEWIKNLVELHENLKNNNEVIETLNVDVFHDRIFVLTPDGDVYDLPQKATPVDFAYSVHTQVGHCCKGAKVNGKIVPLDYELKNGQIVEIITSNQENPNRYWLSFAVTNHAITRIKQWFNSQDHDKLFAMGKEQLNKTLRQLNQPLLDQNYTLF